MMAKKAPAHDDKWYRRDTAATVYFASRTRSWSNVYRNGFVMKEDVDPVALQQAVDDVYPAAKYYFEHGAHGFFWDYLERDENTRVVVPEDNYPCRPVDIFNTTKPMMRIVWHKRRIAMECFHGICDGTASMLLVKTIVARYLELKGVEIPDKSEFIDLDAPAAPEELEDAYQRHYAPMKGLTRKEASAWQIKAKKIPNYFRAVHGITPVADIKNLAAQREMTITDYLLAAMLYALYRNAPRPYKKPVKINVPANLRTVFGTPSRRNFALFANIGFDPSKKADFSFDDIAEEIKGKLKQGVSREELEKMVSLNVKTASSPLVRFMPNAVKHMIVKLGFRYSGQKKFSLCMTNIGIVKMPPEMAAHVDRVESLLGGTPFKRLSADIISDGKMMLITFTGDNKSMAVQRDFFRFLAGRGARIRVECNDWESWGGEA